MGSPTTVRGDGRVFHLKRTPEPWFRKKTNIVDTGERPNVVCTEPMGPSFSAGREAS